MERFVNCMLLAAAGIAAGCAAGVTPGEPALESNWLSDSAARGDTSLRTDCLTLRDGAPRDAAPGDAAPRDTDALGAASDGCLVHCAGKPCGSPDGCDGTCKAGSGCCTASCAGKSCGGSDGCGGTCKTGSGCIPSCTSATSALWDVKARFIKTDFEDPAHPPKVFGQTVSDGQTVYACFNGDQDATYATYPYDCSGHYVGKQKELTWHIERKATNSTTYRVLVRGQAMADCVSGKPVLGQPQCSGEIEISAARGWQIVSATPPFPSGTGAPTCYAQGDSSNHDVTLATHCTVDANHNKVSWLAGSICTGCCECPDAATVEISFYVVKQ